MSYKHNKNFAIQNNVKLLDPHIDRSQERISQLLQQLRKRGLRDRSDEWFSQSMFPNVAEDNADRPVIVRRALAFKTMLEAMTNPANSEVTGSFEIRPGELIVGVIPMGSVGLGKEFPQYLTETEQRVASVTSRDVESTFGHNCPNHQRVLEQGLDWIVNFCRSRRKFLAYDNRRHLGNLGTAELLRKKDSFYEAVQICCKAVIDYAAAFADLAEEQAAACEDPQRYKELLEIARICRKVPAQPAESFHEAVQSVYFVHLALHSTLNLMSLGRLDQLWQPYYDREIAAGTLTRSHAIELIECFLIKCGERLNLSSAYLHKQDHLDFGTALGTNPIFLDQIASANNFLQNIVLSGQTRSGKDATNEVTYLVLEACASVQLPTPTVNVRLHKNTPDALRNAVEDTLVHGGCGLPIIYNDETIVEGFVSAGLPREEALDYVVDGCWEPILNATGDWTFGMVHMLTVLECALNAGALLSTNPSLLRGQKKSYATPRTEEITDFETLKKAVKTHLQFFTDQVALRLYNCYSIDASVTPTPFFSALLGDCLEKGVDKTWGGADYILGGIIAIAVPNCANSLAAINELVFKRGTLSLPELVQALRDDFKGHEGLREMLREVPKFGNNEAEVDSLATWLMNEFHVAIGQASVLADEVFLARAETVEEQARLRSIRDLCGYLGSSLRDRYGDSFHMTFTGGAGTFGQYSFMGGGCAASADGRGRNQPVAPNCSPNSGTVYKGIGHTLRSEGALGLNRFPAGVVLDICLERDAQTQGSIAPYLETFVNTGGNILTLSLASKAQLEQIAKLCQSVRQGLEPPEVLQPHAGLCVRVGGWNAPFITFTEAQQADYLKRI